jgi:hypothetical protein
MSDAMLRMDPEPMSKMNLSPLPSSKRKQADAWARRWSGMPVPQAITRISSFASVSVPG